MKNIFILIGLMLLAAGTFLYFQPQTVPTPIDSTPSTSSSTPAAQVIASDLKVPWDIAFLPGGAMLVTERAGHVIEIEKDGSRHEVAVPGVKQFGESGLLGILLHPDFARNNLLYLYMSTPSGPNQMRNQVVRYTYERGTLTEDKIIIKDIPGAIYHDGGRMEFGPDGMLYITTGDATTPALAQNLSSLAGKILRLTPDGEIPADNPFNTAVYSYGHRNPQGLAWDSAGRLWETEHGPTGELGVCCRDEINSIEAGENYGWPTIVGDQTKSGMQIATLQSGTDVWAPASAAIVGNSLYFGGLMGEALYEAVLSGDSVVELKKHFEGEYGRVRTVRVGPDGMLYVTTSNRDGRGSPQGADDKIIRINPELL